MGFWRFLIWRHELGIEKNGGHLWGRPRFTLVDCRAEDDDIANILNKKQLGIERNGGQFWGGPRLTPVDCMAEDEDILIKLNKHS